MPIWYKIYIVGQGVRKLVPDPPYYTRRQRSSATLTNKPILDIREICVSCTPHHFVHIMHQTQEVTAVVSEGHHHMQDIGHSTQDIGRSTCRGIVAHVLAVNVLDYTASVSCKTSQCYTANVVVIGSKNLLC